MRLCFVLLENAQSLTSRSLKTALKEFPDLGPLTWGSAKKGQSTFEIAGLKLTADLLDSPVPDGEADEATERSLSGLDGSWTLPEHRAHLALAQQGTANENITELTTFTRVVAAIVRATEAVGVYWVEGAATHHPEFVVDIANSELPLPLWVGLSVAETKKGIELLSLGMHQLGLPNLLMTGAALDGPTLEFFYDLLGHVARKGKAIKPGQNVGRTDTEKLVVQKAKSPIHEDETVWLVEIPHKKSKAKVKVKTKAKAKQTRGTKRS
jgi:hypothetical protein